MKKTLLALMLTLGFAATRAQVGSDFSVNMFASLGGGFANYQTELAGFKQGGYFSLSGGKWIMKPLALRVAFDWAQVHSPVQAANHTDYTASYLFGSAEFMWDVLSTFSVQKNRYVNVYPIIGLGFAIRSALDTASASPTAVTDENGSHADNDFQAHLGLQVNCRIPGTTGWYVYLEGRWMMTSNDFDSKHNFSKTAMYPVMLGVTRNFYDHPYHRRTAHETRGLAEDWFIGYNLGVNFSSYNFEHIGTLGMYRPNIGILFGRNFSNFWTIRIEGEALWTQKQYDEVNDRPGDANMIGYLHADVMLNLTHAVRFSAGRRWNIMPYLGAGPVTRFSDPTFTMAADAGVQARYYINQLGDFFVDAKYIMVPPRIGGGSTYSGFLGVGYPSVNVGYIHNFGHSTTRYRMPANFVN